MTAPSKAKANKPVSSTEPTSSRPLTCYDCKFRLAPAGLWMRTFVSGFPFRGLCANHPDTPGELREVPWDGPCRNFRAKRLAPPKPPSDDIRYIPLTQGMHAIVDAADFDWLNQHKWTLQPARCGKTHYAVRRTQEGKIFMHRAIMQPPPGLFVDHINRNGLDNRRSNLRNCTRLQNLQNRYWNAGQSKYRGVSPVGDKWQAIVGYNNETLYLGVFDTEEEAARVRDRKAYELAGEFAYLNFPEEIER